MLGLLLGIIGGPLGLLIGGTFDLDEVDRTESVLSAAPLRPGHTALLIEAINDLVRGRRKRSEEQVRASVPSRAERAAGLEGASGVRGVPAVLDEHDATQALQHGALKPLLEQAAE